MAGTISPKMLALLRRHPDLTLVVLLVTVGAFVRLALLVRIPPLFMQGDSQSYLIPAFDLARGLGFDPILKRPPGYPLLIAGVIRFLGEDLRGLMLVQATIGLVAIVATYWLGRLIHGRAAGAVAGLLTAIGGQLLIYEHYVLAESVFAALLVGGVALVVAGARSRTVLVVLGGATLGLAALFRPIAQLVAPLVLVMVFVAPIVHTRRRFTLSFAAGFATMVVAGQVYSLAVQGGLSGGALGEVLMWRITRSESGYVNREDVQRAPEGSPQRFVLREAVGRTLPQQTYEELVRVHGMTPARADALMRELALEAIGRQPLRYLASTARFSVELFFAEDQRLGEISKRDGDQRFVNYQNRQRSWFPDRVLHLAAPPTDAQQEQFELTEALTQLYQPARFASIIAALFACGAIAALVRPVRRWGLFVVLVVVTTIIANAALSGPESRFRYPIDPLISVVATGGAAWLWSLLRARRLRRRNAAGADRGE